AGGRHPAPPALVRADRRRPGAHPAVAVAEALQRERCRGSVSDRRLRGRRPPRRAAPPAGLRPGIRARRIGDRRVRRLGTDAEDAAGLHRLLPRPAAPGDGGAARMTRLAPGEAVTPEVAGWRYLSFSV